MIFTKSELIDRVKQKGIKGYSKFNKDQLQDILFQPSIFPIELWSEVINNLSLNDLFRLSLCSFTLYSLCSNKLMVLKEINRLKKKWMKPNEFCFIPEEVATQHHIPYQGYVGDFFGLKCNSVLVPKDIIKKLGVEPIVLKKYFNKYGISFTFIKGEKNSYGVCRLDPFQLIQHYRSEERFMSSQVDRSEQVVNEMIDYWIKT